MAAQNDVGVQSNLTRSAVVEAKPASTSHLLYIDNLRTMLITAVILLHLAITYGADGAWYYQDAGEVSELAFIIMMPLAAIGAAFMMGFFCMLAGYFTPRSYDRKGFGSFLVDRLKRLAIPLTFYEIIINPFINYAVSLHDGYRGSLWQYLADYFSGLRCIADGPVWFLLTLMIFSFFYAIWRVVTKPASQSQKEHITDNLPGHGMIALFALVLGLVTFIVRIWSPVNKLYEPWHQELAHYPQYIAMFVIGAVAYRRDWLVKFSDAQVKTWGWIALVCILLLPAIVIAAGVLTGELDDRGAGGWNWISFSYSMWEGFMCVAMVITMLAWFRKRFDHQGWLIGRMSDATFTAYVIHPAVIVPLGLLLGGITLNLGLKFLLVAPLGIALTYLISYYFRWLPLIRDVF